MSRKLKGNAIVSSSVTETQLSTDVVNKITNAYNQANSAYGQANNAAVRVTANSGTAISSNTISFNNTATVSVVVEANGSNANISFVAAPQTVVNDTYTAAGNVAAAATANIANGLYAIGTGAYAQANGAYAQANGAYAQANGAYAQANTTRDVANGAYAQANGAYAQANIAYGQANAAYGQANLAYEAANNSNLKLGGLITGTLNVTQDLIVGGNIYLEGNTTYINVATYSVEDSLIYLASNNDLTDSVDIGFMGGKNTSGIYAHTGFARDATDGKWKLFDGLADEGHVGNVVDFANTYLATLVANVEANSITVLGNAVATATNTAAAYAQANAAYDKSNVAANTVRVSQNSGSTLSAKQLNFVNTGNVKIVVSDSGNGNANISFDTTISGTNTSIISQTFSAASGAGNLQYALTYTPWAAEYVFVSKNGVTLLPATEFTLSGNTLTIIPTGETDDSIEARYFVDVSLIPQSNTTVIIDANTVAAQTNTFYLSQSVSSINRIAVSKNGLRLTPNTHYSLTTANTVTLAAVAEIGDQMLFEYFYDLGNITNIGDAFDQANAAYNAANTRVLKSGDTMTGTLNVQNVIPTTSNTYNLGSSSARFKDLWLSNSTIYLGEATISANGNALIIPSIESSSGNLSSNNVTAERLYGSNNNGDPIIIIRNSAADNAVTFNANTSNNYVHMHSNGVISASGITISGLNLVSQTAGAYGQANAAYGQANAAYGAANNRVLKAGDTMTGQLNISSGGLLVTGNVGIGTTNPGLVTGTNYTWTQVHQLYSAGDAALVVNGNGGVGRLHLVSGTASANQKNWTINSYNGSLTFNTLADTLGDTERVRINSSGFVGIGTTNPTANLHVHGSASALRITGINAGAAASVYVGGNAEFYKDAAVSKAASIGMSPTGGGMTDDMVISMYNGSSWFERMRLTNGGNLGIGTTNPSVNLHIESSGTSGAFSELFRIRSGNDANDTGGALGIFQKDNSRGLIIRAGRGTGDQAKADFILNRSGLSIPSGTQDTVMTFLQTGLVGIGNASPGFKLDISEAGEVISGTATTGSNMRGLRIYNTTTATTNNAIGLWLATGPHQAGIASFRADAAGTWETSLAFYTHGNATTNLNDATERMRISGEGYVTKPYQPAFTAWSNLGWETYTSGAVITFNGTRLNTGSHYNTSNGRFTAPVAGRYFFTWTGYAAAAESYATALTINGSQLGSGDVAPFVYKGASGQDGTLTTSVILNLNVNDYVEVRTRSGYSTRIYMGHSHFSGYLIG